MEWYKILALCLSCFSLGISLTGLVFSSLEYKRATRRLARLDALRANLEEMEKGLEACKQLIQYDWETPGEFVKRVQDKLAQGKLTPNAARASVGLPPLGVPGKHKAEEPKQ